MITGTSLSFDQALLSGTHPFIKIPNRFNTILNVLNIRIKSCKLYLLCN